MHGVLQDLRLAWRGIRAKPGFSAVVIITLALGIGVNTAVFSLANTLLLRPVSGVDHPQRLIFVRFEDPQGRRAQTSYPNIEDLAARVTALSGLAGETPDWPAAVQVEGARPRMLRASSISAEYFRVLGVPMSLGRSFTRDQEAIAYAAPVAVVSHDFWLQSLQSDPKAAGRYIMVAGLRTLVVGVAPPGFHGTDRVARVDLWVPGSEVWAINRIRAGDLASVLVRNRQAQPFRELIGRLTPGATAEEVQAQLTTAAATLGQAYPVENSFWRGRPPVVYSGIGLAPDARRSITRAIDILGAIAVLVLLVACANVANLYLFRGVTRRQAIGVRRALGASAFRLVRAEVVESLLTAAIGCIIATIPATLMLASFRGQLFASLGHDVTSFTIDVRVGLFAVAIAVVTGIVAGAAPAVAAALTDVAPLLADSARTRTAGRGPTHAALSVGQLACSLALVGTTLLLVQTARNLQRVDVGFDADHVAALDVSPLFAGASVTEAQQTLRQTIERVRATPGVQEVALVAYTPFTYSMGDRVRRLEAPTDSGASSTTVWVSPTYFAAMGIQLLGGRTFDDAEEYLASLDSTSHVTVLAASLARRLFPHGDAIGQLVSAGGLPWERVIGIAGDSHWASVTDEGAGPVQYVPLPAFAGGGTLLVRSHRPLAETQHRVEDVVAALSPGTPVSTGAMLRDNVQRSFADQRLLARALSIFAGLVLTLASVGLYGVIAFDVAQRNREIGIRMALGAGAQQVLGMILKRGGTLGLIGLVIGLGGALAGAQLVRNQLFGVTSLDPRTYAAAAGLLALVVLFASWIPARRAAKVDPAITLRAE